MEVRLGGVFLIFFSIRVSRSMFESKQLLFRYWILLVICSECLMSRLFIRSIVSVIYISLYHHPLNHHQAIIISSSLKLWQKQIKASGLLCRARWWWYIIWRGWTTLPSLLETFLVRGKPKDPHQGHTYMYRARVVSNMQQTCQK